MESRLHEAATEGNVSLLQELLQQDPLLLDLSSLTGPCRNPLHVAALLGHADFARKVLELNPRLASEIDSRGFSPLHHAATKGHLEVVREFLHTDSQLCSLCDANGRNPLHLAAINGHVHALEEMIKTSPDSARPAVDHGGTILHLCVKNNQLESLKLLIEAVDDTIFLNAKDDYGFTILHIAVANKDLETVKFLVNTKGMEVNATNSNGLTPLDVLIQSSRDIHDLDIAESLRAFGAHRTTTVSMSEDKEAGGSKSPGDGQGNWLSSERDALMVVASVIATMAFQVGTNPPGGVWQEDNKETLAGKSVAGKSVAASNTAHEFATYTVFFTVGFGLSLIVLLWLIIGRGNLTTRFSTVIHFMLGGAFSAIGFGYWYSIRSLTPESALDRIKPALVADIVFFCVGIGVIVLICLRKSIKSTVGKLILRLRRLNCKGIL